MVSLGLVVVLGLEVAELGAVVVEDGAVRGELEVVLEPELGVVELEPELPGVVEPDPCVLLPPLCCSLWLCCEFDWEPALWVWVEAGAGAAGGAPVGTRPWLTCWN